MTKGLAGTLAAVTILLAVGGTPPPASRAEARTAPFDSSAALAKARALHEAIRSSDVPRLWREFDPRMRAAFGDEAGFDKALQQIRSQVGRLSDCVRDEVKKESGLLVYTAYCRFDNTATPLVLLIAFDREGAIAGLWVKPEAKAYQSPYLSYESRTRLRLPFYGEWTVFWGGRTLEQNYHAVTADQRFAYDLLITKQGSSHVGDGAHNTDYYAFGSPILAPAAGKVAWVEDGVPDNYPGRMNPARPVGNCVVLDHGQGEFSLFAHLKNGSVRVKPGQEVAQDDTLGLCGNSGNSSEPHLHYHLQNGPTPLRAEGLPAPFVDFVADGKAVERGEPVKGQRIRRAP